MTDKQDIIERLKAQFFGMYDESNLTADEVVVADAIAEIEQLREHLMMYKETPDWQPIETAPNGVPILCGKWNDDKWINMICSKDASKYALDQYGHPIFDEWMGGHIYGGAFWVDDNPTHWMPLPTPPETE